MHKNKAVTIFYAKMRIQIVNKSVNMMVCLGTFRTYFPPPSHLSLAINQLYGLDTNPCSANCLNIYYYIYT